jgi:hypothetical protein
MEATWITIAIIAGLVVVIVVPVCAMQWSRVRRAEADARVKQDMLARGLSVEEMERLLNPSPVQALPPKSPPVSPPVSRPVSRRREAAIILATAIESMVQASNDTNDIAALLEVFLQQHSGPQETSQESNQPLQPTGPAIGRPEEFSSSSRPQYEKGDIEGHRAGPQGAPDIQDNRADYSATGRPRD